MEIISRSLESDLAYHVDERRVRIALIELLHDPNDDVRRISMTALYTNPMSPEVWPLLILLERDSDTIISMMATTALAKHMTDERK